MIIHLVLILMRQGEVLINILEDYMKIKLL